MTGEDIKRIRLEQNMSQEYFGKLIGLSKSGISNLENGTRKITGKVERMIEIVFLNKISLSHIPTPDLIAELERRCADGRRKNNR